MNMDMASMNMYFFTSTTTPLFSKSWTPSSTGQYAGSCIFLIVLAIVSRCLGAFRHFQERKWLDKAINRRYIVVAGNDEEGERTQPQKSAEDEKSETAVLTVRGVNENVRVVKTSARDREGTPFRFSTDLPRACIFTVQAGVGYLLMLAVMSFNVGYFLSVLAGFFLGEIAFGRFTALDGGALH